MVTLPAEKGDARNLTNTVGVHERDPVWSPDGKQIAYFSDEGGRYMLHVRSQDGKGDIKKIALNGAGFYNTPVWSPDSQKISYVDNSYSLYWLDLATGTIKKISSEPYYGPSFPKVIQHTWSPDSKWLAYTQSSKSWIHAVLAYSIEQDKSFPITDGLSDVGEPVFDASGRYLYFFGSTDAGPIVQWFDMSNADMRRTRSALSGSVAEGIFIPVSQRERRRKRHQQRREDGKGQKDKGDTSKGQRTRKRIPRAKR